MVETEFAIVGAGVTGLLVARELLRAGRSVTVIERGPLRPHDLQLANGHHETPMASTRHNHEAAAGLPAYPWNYVYGVGGSTLSWAGVAPRFLPSDFELHSRYGVGRDWPISYADLQPFYAEAERALAVAGGAHELFPGSDSLPQPAHPLSPVDRLLAPLLEPYLPLPQARPTLPAGARPACCGAATCGLCPVDSRYTALHTLADERMLEHPAFSLLDRTVVLRLRADDGSVTGLECATADGRRFELRAGQVVLAASGIENPGLLLRSGLDGPHVGRWLFDHEHTLIEIELDRPAEAGHGATPATGTTYRYADGDWRSERASAFVLPVNGGMRIGDVVASEVAGGRRGKELRARISERYRRTVMFDAMFEDLPLEDRRVELSHRRDGFGVPLNRIRYGPDSPYLIRARDGLVADLEQRLRPLGARLSRVVSSPQGAHLLGTCRMGPGGVVDADLRHERLANLSIAGGSAFPAYSAAHPTLTIAALAIRLGRRLVAEAGA